MVLGSNLTQLPILKERKQPALTSLKTFPANLCSLLRGTEFARFANNLGEPVG